MTTPEEMKALLTEIAVAIQKTRFAPCAAPVGCKAYAANEDGWQIFVITFTHAGRRGFDGSASRTEKLKPQDALLKDPPAPKLLVMHLTPELAKLGVELAEKQTLS